MFATTTCLLSDAPPTHSAHSAHSAQQLSQSSCLPSRVISVLTLDPLTPSFASSFSFASSPSNSSDCSPSLCSTDSSSTSSIDHFPSLYSASHLFPSTAPHLPPTTATTYSTAPITTTAAPTSPKTHRTTLSSTCVCCREAKVRCDGNTPCSRCIRLTRVERCWPATNKRKRKVVDPPHSSTNTADAATTHSVDTSQQSCMAVVPRPFKRGQLSVLEQVDPLGAYTAPLDDPSVLPSVRLSRLLLRQSLYCFYRGGQERPKLGDTGRPMATTMSRWLAYARYSTLLSPTDLTSMIHATAYIVGIPIKQHTDSGQKTLLRLHERSDTTHDGHCTGDVCGGMCIGPRQLIADRPIQYVFTASPNEPIDDSEYNNFACLTFRHTSNDQLRQLQRFADTHYAASHVWTSEVVDYSIVVRVNRAFERLLGRSQRAVRALYQQHSFYALYELFAESEWSSVMAVETAVEYGSTSVEYEGVYQFRARCRHQTGSEVVCWVHKSYERDEHGMVVKGCYTFIPIKTEVADVLMIA